MPSPSAVHRYGLRELNAGSIINSSNGCGGFPDIPPTCPIKMEQKPGSRRKLHFQKLVSENPYEVVKDGSTNPGATGAVEPFVAVSQVDSKTGEEAAGAETEAGE
jgi:hypothetical protein